MSSSELVTVDAVEALMLTKPQVGCQIIHHFHPGIYIRECLIPADTSVTSHHHRGEHTNVHQTGIILMCDPGGEPYISEGPRKYTGKPGKKVGYAKTAVVWWNIFPTTETDVDKLEEMFFVKSAAFLDLAGRVHAQRFEDHQLDRNDFHMALDEMGITPFQAREASECQDDQGSTSADWGVVIRQSAIEGRGVFVQVPTPTGQFICPARIAGKRTPAGRFANHSRNPNAKFVERNGDAYLEAIRPIAPYCSETVPGDEVTVDYRQALSLVGRLT